MTFTGRIRLFLVLVALVPPLLVMSVIYSYSVNEIENDDRQAASDNISRYEQYDARFASSFLVKVDNLRLSDQMRRTIGRAKSGRLSRVDLSFALTEFDFVELVDNKMKVIASGHRPGLIGEFISMPYQKSTLPLVPTIEYDTDGRHAALSLLVPFDSSLSLYIGRYVNPTMLDDIRPIILADVKLTFDDSLLTRYATMALKTLYEDDNSYRSVLAGTVEAGWLLLASFDTGQTRPVFVSLLKISSVVALLSVLVAILLGWFITGRAKREFDNLISATDRVAGGDLKTPVMAYEEGEFSHLADSFTDMIFKVRSAQDDLATSEKIAAWQVMARKIAHEIKNPLSPIGIAADDLRLSYHQNLPNFGQTLDDTTSTIRTEIARLTRLLDEFSSFARMKPPEIARYKLDDLIEPLSSLHKREIESGRFTIDNQCQLSAVLLDKDSVRQLLLNLIKNGLEAGEETTVQLLFGDNSAGELTISVTDNGPGFTPDQLQRSFQPYLSTKTGGTGLGLVICQRIVYDHGGTIELSNSDSGGASITIKLPQAGNDVEDTDS